MTDNEIKQLVASNAKTIQALANSMATDRQERQEERSQLYQYLGRIAAAQSNFYEIQSDYYHQLATLSEKQTKFEERQLNIEEKQLKIEEKQAEMQAEIVAILRHLSIGEIPSTD
ncbi:hypothetical protein [Aphanothece sacrum]|uniref:Uncharacterized protein n=1 Tax=Aphanothece sacrum FPU1 TaxID=1920663 RepID=A0A401III0_APHSA|nr:hypothetical protein [Aphanothece sacrum]GBF80980.1 hypothetical protein AsFPU1_2389 [Aphanothece sacrum FPU1]GBF85287.1 hypothetical protein AsFPU3_2346 [Aphanothece sacrum FPU3]